MNELVCESILENGKLKTLCVFKGKEYRRIMKGNKRGRENAQSIANYLIKQGHKIDNVRYDEYGIG